MSGGLLQEWQDNMAPIYRHDVNSGPYVPPPPWTSGQSIPFFGVSRVWCSHAELETRLERAIANIGNDPSISRLDALNCPYGLVIFIAEAVKADRSVFSYSVNLLLTDIGAVILRMSD